MRERTDNFSDFLLASAALTLWLVCAAAGVIGFYVPYPRPAPPVPDFQTQLVQADLPQDANPAPPPPPEALPPPEPVLATPEAAPTIPAAPPTATAATSRCRKAA